MLFPLFLVPTEKSGFRTTNGMSDAMTSNGKYITVEAASMLQDAGAERCGQFAAAWPWHVAEDRIIVAHHLQA